MYLKVIRGTETFDKLNAVWDKIDECNKIAKAFVNELGLEKFGKARGKVAGGVSCVESDNEIKGWKSVGKQWQRIYFPKANQKELLTKIENLPTVSHEEYNECIGFEDQITGVYHIISYNSKRNKNEILIKIEEEANYTPKPDMIEITFSEYTQLMKQD